MKRTILAAAAASLALGFGLAHADPLMKTWTFDYVATEQSLPPPGCDRTVFLCDPTVDYESGKFLITEPVDDHSHTIDVILGDTGTQELTIDVVNGKLIDYEEIDDLRHTSYESYYRLHLDETGGTAMYQGTNSHWGFGFIDQYTYYLDGTDIPAFPVPVPIPEPTSALLVIAGLGVLVASKRRVRAD